MILVIDKEELEEIIKLLKEKGEKFYIGRN